MSAHFEELDRRSTPIGEISLRRRLEPAMQIDVYEAKLDDEYLMSSLFTGSEVALAELGLARVEGADLDVVVGGLGLGYTAQQVLADARVRSLHVVEALGEVIAWHERGLLPVSAELTSDPRCHFVKGDFFALVAGDGGFGPGVPERCHAVLVDIDHSPHHHLHPSHAGFYTPGGLRRVTARLQTGGVFGLWSDDPPDDAFTASVEEAVGPCEAQVVTFPTPYDVGESASTVYFATVDAR
ncbi:MAG: spermidine synthase [Acidimicrobiales bacterium]